MLWDYLERYLPTWERPSEEASVKLKNEETEFKGHEITGKLLHKESKGNVKEKVKEKKCKCHLVTQTHDVQFSTCR